MVTKPVVLKVLLRQRHLQSLPAFNRHYDKIAQDVDPALKGRGPSKAQFYRWLKGDMQGLPYPDHCRILEAMFPGWTAAQLFEPHDGGLEFVPEPPVITMPTPIREPGAPAVAELAGITAAFTTRPAFAHEFPPHRLFDEAETISMVGLSLNMLCQQYSDRSLLELLETGSTVNCLFLDPAGENTKAREREEGHPEGVLTTLTTLNMQTLQRLQNKLSDEARDNLTIRTYDQPPRFNITVIDNSMCVVQPYLPDARGVESPTFITEKRDSSPGLFETFATVFDTMWNNAAEVTA